MKKELNYKSKRKWIVGGLAAFTSVALLTTGFATWIVGVNNTDNKNAIGVTVDTAKNNSIVFTMTLTSSSIELKEKNVTSGKIITVTENDIQSDPLTIDYKDLQIVYGSSAVFSYKSIQFTIEDPTTEEDKKTYVSVKTAADASKLTGNNYARSGSDFTYLEPPSPINLKSYEPTQNGSIFTYSISSGSLQFKWGSFFDNKSPATFYNTKYAEEGDNAKLATASGEITTELEAMKTQLNGKKIKLVATLSETEVA